MRKALTLLVTIGLGALAPAGIAGAQDTITSDGGYVMADDENGGAPVEGGGVDIVYGDVSTGNTGGEVLGDPNAVYYPDLSSVPSQTGQPWSPTIVGIPVGHAGAGDMIGGFDIDVQASMAEQAAAEQAAAEQAASGGEVSGETVAAEDGSTASEGDTVVVDDTGMPVE
ncbi:MAG: hypothetical protein ACKOWF_00490 [Chloroflexota bacterium]